MANASKCLCIYFEYARCEWLEDTKEKKCAYEMNTMEIKSEYFISKHKELNESVWNVRHGEEENGGDCVDIARLRHPKLKNHAETN